MDKTKGIKVLLSKAYQGEAGALAKIAAILGVATSKIKQKP